jgi:hypothetical protein
MHDIPDDGVLLDCSALTAGTEYYVYLYDSSGTLTLEASTTVPTTNEGIQVKTGATSRRYLGMIVPKALISTHQGAVDVKDRRLVSNLYNRRLVSVGKDNPYSGYTTFTPTTSVYGHDIWEKWNNADDWKAELVLCGSQHVGLHAFARYGTNNSGKIGIGVDQITPEGDGNPATIGWGSYNADTLYVPHTVILSATLTPGYHYAIPVAYGFYNSSADHWVIYLKGSYGAASFGGEVWI